MSDTYPQIVNTVLDAPDPRALAEFYREFLGFTYREGDEPPTDGSDDQLGRDWLVLRARDGGRGLAFQGVERMASTTWPEPDVPQQMHLDMLVDSPRELDRQRDRAVALGATVRFDRRDDKQEPLYVFADPAGHLFCVFCHGEAE